MFLIIGLGNPGEKYQNTRHNIGARVIEKLKPLNLVNVILAKPTTFMNNSGKAVKLLTKRHPLNANNLIVIHDDIDLPLGKIKIVKNRGAAGHKGVASIIENLGTKDFIRLRMGIQPKTGRPDPDAQRGRGSDQKRRRIQNVESFVLKKFNKEEEEIVKEVIEKTVEAIETFLREGLEKAMSRYN